MKNAVAYIRVSTEEQAKSGLGLSAQRMRIHAYAAAMGISLGNVYEDAGLSGSTMDRPALNAMLSDIRSRGNGPDAVDMVVVLKLDRCGRSTRGVLDFIASLRDMGCEFASVSEGFDTSTPVGRMVLTIMAALAEFELETIRERTSNALAAKRASGDRTHRCPQYGFLSLAEGGWMVVPSEIAVIDRIFRLRYLNGYGYSQIAKTLENEGFNAFAPSPSQVRHKLACGHYLPVISREAREAALAAGAKSKPLPNDSVLSFDPTAQFTEASARRLATLEIAA